MVVKRIGRIIDSKSNILDKIGFIQGRLSPKINNLIQAFPWNYWQDEFAIAKKHDFKIMEWTLDQQNLYKNPLMYVKGRKVIKSLMKKNNISIFSLTGDCFMQQPFYKNIGKIKENLLNDLKNIIFSCGKLKIRYIVFPLVDNGKIENDLQEKNLKNGLLSIESLLKKTNVKICFESDFMPLKLGNFIDQYSTEHFGINYDIGNSASLDYNIDEEISTYGHRIMNVHVKDRQINGTTVPLGNGNADFPAVFQALKTAGYKGNYILQTARAENDDHVGVLIKYKSQVSKWII